MIRTIVVRGSTGVTGFERLQYTRVRGTWRCLRDQFELTAPERSSDVVAFLQSLSQHAATHVGTVSQVVELEL